MSASSKLSILSLAALLVAAGPAGAGAPAPGTKNANLPHICKGGTNKNDPCDANNGNADCPGSTCVFKFNEKAYKGTLIVSMDENVTNESDQPFAAQAATALLEMKANGQKRFFAETYSDGLNPMTFGVWNDPVTEDNLIDVTQAQDWVEQNPAGLFADALRSFLSETGTPVVTDASIVSRSDGRGVTACTEVGKPEPCCTGPGTGTCSGSEVLGSVVKLKIKFRFVAP